MTKRVEEWPAMILWLLVPIAIIITALLYSCEPAHAQEATPSPVPTPADDATAEEVYEYIIEQPGHESWVDCNYDPVVTRMGTYVCAKDEVYQLGDFAVICTHGYNNFYYDDKSGDIRGLWEQGFIDIESTEVSFKLMDLFVSTVYTGNGNGNNNGNGNKWGQVTAIKKLTGKQVKPSTPAKVKWQASYGLGEKKKKWGGGK